MLYYLPAHRLLNDVVDLVAVRLVENWRIAVIVIVVCIIAACVLVVRVVRVVMVCGCPVEWTLGVRHLDIVVVIADHLPVVRTQSVLVLVMVLVELDHGELLLERACALLFHCDAMLHIIVIAALVLAGCLDHVAIVRTVFLDVGLMACGRIS